MTFRARNDIHLARRIWHVCGVMTVFTLYWFLDSRTAAIATITFSALFILCDVTRLYSPFVNRFFTWILGPVMRESERHRISGGSSMAAGLTLIILLYTRNVVLLSLLFLAFADPLASYFGIRYGKDKLIGNKSLQGSAAAFVACFVLAIIFFNTLDLMPERLFIVCLLAAFIGAISELVPVGRMDDNFVFPVLSATLLTGLYYVFGGL